MLVKTATAHPNVTKDPPPDAVLKQFGEDALVFVLGFTTERFHDLRLFKAMWP